MIYQFDIPLQNIERLENRIARLNKKAAKLDVPLIGFTKGEIFIKKTFDGKIKFQKVIIVGDSPVIEGWKFVAAIDHVDGKNIVKKLDSNVVLHPMFYTRNPFCDHCKTKKVKKYSFIIRNVDSGEQKQVGKKCLGDFLTVELGQKLQSLQWLPELVNELMDEDSPFYQGGKVDYYYNVKNIITLAFAAVRQWGFKKADDTCPTKLTVLDHVYKDGEDNFDKFGVIAEDIENADAAIKWLEVQDGSRSDFIFNLKQFVEMGEVPAKYFGYLVAIPATFKRATAEQVEVNNSFVGIVKSRDTFKVTLLKKLTIDGYYGTSWLHTFIDDKKRMVTWFSNKPTTLKVKDETELTAFIKEHKVYNGVNQTVINRVKFV